ncbi:hypothetical protein IPA_06970 [Ignicoccus pacificus DSM 13166]|uniref:Uncharacterized protein n=1 Tax=Ignicoccus pacificus DSM 13166 TaxID=940294 RepID=A0A977KBM5_9CREN|nr:hypothetical protein IPA_06970 [Ignicoccus pacificus DSM 13166]
MKALVECDPSKWEVMDPKERCWCECMNNCPEDLKNTRYCEQKCTEQCLTLPT